MFRDVVPSPTPMTGLPSVERREARSSGLRLPSWAVR